MEKQSTFADAGFEKHRKKTHRKQFLEDTEVAVSWQELVKVVEPYYPSGEGPTRRPIGIERMLRIHFYRYGSTYQTLQSRRRCTTLITAEECATNTARRTE